MKWIYLLVLSVLFSCSSKPEFVKDPSGMEYKVISEEVGDQPLPGQFLKIQTKQVYNDSVLYDSREHLPQYIKLDTIRMTKESYLIFSRVRAGDSIIFKVSADSVQNIAPGFCDQRRVAMDIRKGRGNSQW